MDDVEVSENRRKRPRPPVITHSSILILSSFIVGIAVQRTLPADQVLIVLAAGVVGMLSYLGLDYTAKLRAEKRELEAEEKSAERIEGRLHRHVPASTPTVDSTPAKLKERVDWQSLVAVAEKTRK